MIVAVADTNGDRAVDFEEFFDKLKFYVTTAFEVLDGNEDGSILDEAKDGNIFNSIPYAFFEKLLDQVFEFFDLNKDGIITYKDFLWAKDRICQMSGWKVQHEMIKCGAII